MSRWRSERLELYLAPERVCVARSGFGRQRDVTMLPVEPSGTRGWQGTIAVFREWLGARGSHKGAAAVVVSNRWVRYAVVPWSDHILGADEETALASACLDGLYGASDSAWDIKVASAPYGAPRLACAVDAALLSELRMVCARHALRLRLIQPHFVWAVNRLPGSRLRSHCALMVATEGAHAVIASMARGQWCSVRAMHLPWPGIEAIQAVADREQLLQGLPENTPVLRLPGWDDRDEAFSEVVAHEETLD